MTEKDNSSVYKLLDELSSEFNPSFKEAAVILAAGHGKRIKSHRSKMLHKIWEVPTVDRVFNACRQGIKNINVVIVVGIKAEDVMQVIGKRNSTLFAYQEEQNGTGHAVQVGLDRFEHFDDDGIVYILPGDMGLIDAKTMTEFRNKFIESKSDMMVLTGKYKGDPLSNSYGRIIRAKEKDANGKSSGNHLGNVIEIKEYKDILALREEELYLLKYNSQTFSFTKSELLEIDEFNSGVYAFRYKYLKELISKLESNNVQNEIYITDLISLFNRNNLTVTASSPSNNYAVMGFNNKSVLKEMEEIRNKQVYEMLKDIIEIDDPDDFFIHEEVVSDILEQDKKGEPLDIVIGKGVYIGRGVKLNYNLEFKKNVFVNGNIVFGKNVKVYHNAYLSCFKDQKFIIGDNVQILWGDIIKGNIVIGEGSRIESSVNMTGSDEFPLRIGKNVLVKGTSYIFGSVIEDNVQIEHSVIIKKKIKKVMDKSGAVIPLRYFIPVAEGLEAIEDI